MPSEQIPPIEIPANHCRKCPTAQSIRQGYDPEAYDIIRSKSMVESEIENGSHIYCPWRETSCIVYPVELQWAKRWHDAGELPPISLAPCFGGNPLPDRQP